MLANSQEIFAVLHCKAIILKIICCMMISQKCQANNESALLQLATTCHIQLSWMAESAVHYRPLFDDKSGSFSQTWPCPLSIQCCFDKGDTDPTDPTLYDQDCSCTQNHGSDAYSIRKEGPVSRRLKLHASQMITKGMPILWKVSAHRFSILLNHLMVVKVLLKCTIHFSSWYACPNFCMQASRSLAYDVCISSKARSTAAELCVWVDILKHTLLLTIKIPVDILIGIPPNLPCMLQVKENGGQTRRDAAHTYKWRDPCKEGTCTDFVTIFQVAQNLLKFAMPTLLW